MAGRPNPLHEVHQDHAVQAMHDGEKRDTPQIPIKQVQDYEPQLRNFWSLQVQPDVPSVLLETYYYRDTEDEHDAEKVTAFSGAGYFLRHYCA